MTPLSISRKLLTLRRHCIGAASLFALAALPLHAELERVEPTFWWVGMQEPSLQLLVHGDDIGALQPQVDYPGVSLRETIRVENPNYLFLYLEISPAAQSGSFEIDFTKDGQVAETYTYRLLDRRPGSAQRAGFDSSDVIYQIVPDRFANGNPSNDSVASYRETAVDRSKPFGRHGGDIAGITQHLDYISDMGFTALWLTPVLENDQPDQSYHGYAITDFYKVDERMGTLEDYRQLATDAEQHGVKLIMDMILNHCGSEHWWMKDMPMADWINYYPDYRVTTHQRTTNEDPHASQIDTELMRRGWFVPSMPDMNVMNPLLADYLIQNTIWWVEYLDLAGIRVDTYPYPDKRFTARWCQRVLAEYPRLNIVGEEWSYNPAITSYWQRGQSNLDGYDGHLPSVFDFPMQQAIEHGLMSTNHEPGSWGDAFDVVYTTLAQDFLYPQPDNLTIFLGNHDMPRIFVRLGENVDLARNALVWLVTMRGIPQFLYGDEILMSHPEGENHGLIRADFPGGWDGDTSNAFKGEGLDADASAFQDLTRRLMHWRQGASAVQHGKLIHFAPEHDVYVYFRLDDQQAVMVVLNRNDEPYHLPLERFQEILGNYTEGRDVITGDDVPIHDSLELSARTPVLLELH